MKLEELAADLENQKQKKNTKGKQVLVDEAGRVGSSQLTNDTGSKKVNQEKLDEMLAASLAAEDGRFTSIASTSGAGIISDEDDSDADEEMILPAMQGKVDPAVLAALPPSMQLDLLGQMRERLMADNRQKYQKVKKAPAKFSELQIQAYLKTVAFRREIDEVQKSAAGRGVGGVQTSRIASEANREFIFSSSFTGDKQALTSSDTEEKKDEQHHTGTKHCSVDSLNCSTSTVRSITAAYPGSAVDESQRIPVNDLETYLDERGRVRVSRVRAMGIRMTRDLQRNLDLMKEVEQEKMTTMNTENINDTFNEQDHNVPTSDNQFPGSSGVFNDKNSNRSNCTGTVTEGDNHSQLCMPSNGISIEISIENEDVHESTNGDDDIFARLVAGSPVTNPSLPKTLDFDSAANVCWEEGTVGFNDAKSSLLEDNNSHESDVEWEEGGCAAQGNSESCQSECRIALSRGVMEEEADIQEAIKRSLEELKNQKPVGQLSGNMAKEMTHEGATIENEKDELKLQNILASKGSLSKVAEIEEVKFTSSSGLAVFPVAQLTQSLTDLNKKEGLIKKASDVCHFSEMKLSRDVCESINVEKLPGESVLCVVPSESHMTREQPVDDMSGINLVDGDGNNFKTVQKSHPKEPIGVSISQEEFKEGKSDINEEGKLVEESNNDRLVLERKSNLVKPTTIENREIEVDISAANLVEEMLILDQERADLSAEQRKLERNAESVSSEMFAECQELLQMFGLPYIIAPMEAEAQCAYMEMRNLVDGVVTDDSDVFLFGGRSVYKNIFDDRKYVETYFMKDLESELGLTREKLIRMALLLGSDYTEGVSGVGIVNAIEVVNAFPEEDGLHNFRKWIESPDPMIFGKLNLHASTVSKKRGPKVGDNSTNCPESNAGVSDAEESIYQVGKDSQSDNNMQSLKQTFMDKHRNVSKNWHIPSSFPSEAVMSAYISAQVDKSTELFSWGKPDLSVLRKMCWEKFGWGGQKADELLLPVLKEYSKHETQLRLEAFYTFNERFAKIRSRRVQNAVKGITEKQSLDLMEDASQDSKSRKKRKTHLVESGDNKSEKSLDGMEDNVVDGNGKFTQKSTAKQPRKRSRQGDHENLEPHRQAGCSSKGSMGKGRGRGRDRGRGQGTGRARRKGVPGWEDAEYSSGNGSDRGVTQHLLVGNSEGQHELRRSARSRKHVNYTAAVLDIDDGDKSPDQSHINGKSIDDSHIKSYNEQTMELGPSQCQSDVADAVLSQKILDGVGNLSRKDLYGNCFEVGGGFCPNEGEPETETGQAGVRKNIDSFIDGDISKEYLRFGGGFCGDEDVDECVNNLGGDTICQNDLLPCIPAPVDELELDIDPIQSGSNSSMAVDGRKVTENTGPSVAGQIPKRDRPLHESRVEDPQLKPLSAMPLLRRKKRKS